MKKKKIVFALLSCLFPALMASAQSISSRDIQGAWIISAIYDSRTDDMIYVPAEKALGWAFTDIEIDGAPISILTVGGETTRLVYEIKGRKICFYADIEKEDVLAMMEVLEVTPKRKMIVRMFLDFSTGVSYKALLSYIGD